MHTPYTAIKTSEDPNKPPLHPGQMTNDPGQMTNDPGQMTNDPGQMTNDPGQMTNDPSPQSKAGRTQRDNRLLIRGIKHCYTQEEKGIG